MSTLLLVPLDDIVIFPNMNVTISAEVGDEDRVLLVPRHEGQYAKVGTVAEVADRVRIEPGRDGRVRTGDGFRRRHNPDATCGPAPVGRSGVAASGGRVRSG